ncbi:MAG: hypothetical protein KAJ42_06750, partial [Gemmatimonadetes bacterium]|nr:hypothetical protein [Gemmatimonadota bacterium]
GTAGGLTGTPTSAADFSFTVQVQDSEGATASRGLTLRVCEAPVSLSPGDVIALAPSGSDGCSFFLPSGSNGDRYRFAVIWPESDEEQVSPRIATVTTSVVAVSPTPAPAAAVSALERAPLELPADLMSAVRVANATEAYHAELRARERRMLRDMGGSLQLLPDRAETPTRSAPLLASAPDKKSFDVNFDGCDATSPGPVVTAIKIVEDDRFAVYQDSTVHATDSVSTQNVQMMLDYYRDYGESIITDYFDGISDVNEDDRVDIFITPIVEEGVAAFVWSGDFFDKSDCAQSNEAEVVYFAKSQIDDLDDDKFQALPTLVHEVKHVSSLYKSIRRYYASGGLDDYHPDWIEEGGAEIAGEMSSRKAWATLSGGPAVGDMANRQHKLNTGITKENYGILMRWARTIYYMYSQPNGVVVTPTGAHASHSIYGSGWHFHRWLGDAYGNASTAYADAAFFESQNDSLSTSGVAGILDLTGKNWTQLMEEYAAAVMYNGTGAPQPIRAFTTHDFVSGLTGLLTNQPEGSYPYPVNLSGTATSSPFTSGTYSGSIGASGIRVHDFTSNGTGVGMGVEVTMTGGRVVVVRLN